MQRERAFSRPMVRRVWLSVSLLDLLWVYGVQVRWWMARGRSVVCDRYIWNTFVDFRLYFPTESVEQWWLWRLLIAVTPVPDVAFLLVIPVEESVARSDRKGEPFRDGPEVLARRRALYEALAGEGRWYILDGMRAQDDLQQEIQARIARVISRGRAQGAVGSEAS